MAIRLDILLACHRPSFPSSLPNPAPPFVSNPKPPRPRFSPAGRGAAAVKIAIEEGVTRIRNRISCIAKGEAEIESHEFVKERSVSVVLLAGGRGKRMGANMPKQYLPLLGQPIALYSFYTFSQMSEVKEIVVVCDPSYKDIFEEASKEIEVTLKFAVPGKERQHSVFNGFEEIDGSSKLVCIHDSARPLVSSGDITKVLKDGWLNGAAVLGVPVKATIKEANSDSFVKKTLDRNTLWEMQTPQVIKPELLRLGFDLVNRNNLEVTDDVSIVEHLEHPVYITEGSYTNIKFQLQWLQLQIRQPNTTLMEEYLLGDDDEDEDDGFNKLGRVTTPDDLLLAERILNMNAVTAAA